MVAMSHPGLPALWGLASLMLMLFIALRAVALPRATVHSTPHLALAGLPLVGPMMRHITRHPGFLFVLKLVFVALFVLIIAAGLYGTPLPARNVATVLTWNLWWAGLVVSVFFVGSAWCAVCPWNTLAGWLARHRLWRRADTHAGLNLRLPAGWRNVMPALALFIILTWLELGIGVTLDPFATALLALLMLFLATVFAAVFEGGAFCQYFCPVGRSIGFYAQLAPVELRPVEPDICARCTTLECFAGSAEVDPCPTHLVMGRLKQNTYCLSCGNCARSCPHENVAWRLRSPASEAMQDSRPHWDEAWFMIGLLALTGFHGLTMLPAWDTTIKAIARAIGDGRQMLVTFSLALGATLLLAMALYTASIRLSARLGGIRTAMGAHFNRFAFVALPLAFAYHLAHNLGHLLREGAGLGKLLANPFGIGTLPLGMAEKQARMMHMVISQNALFTLQAGLLIAGFLIAALIARRRLDLAASPNIVQLRGQLLPVLLFALAVSLFHLWLLMQPMSMRM